MQKSTVKDLSSAALDVVRDKLLSDDQTPVIEELKKMPDHIIRQLLEKKTEKLCRAILFVKSSRYKITKRLSPSGEIKITIKGNDGVKNDTNLKHGRFPSNDTEEFRKKYKTVYGEKRAKLRSEIYIDYYDGLSDHNFAKYLAVELIMFMKLNSDRFDIEVDIDKDAGHIFVTKSDSAGKRRRYQFGLPELIEFDEYFNSVYHCPDYQPIIKDMIK